MSLKQTDEVDLISKTPTDKEKKGKSKVLKFG
jgi:hypothetical protein